eukprot:scaffold21742_cov58-Skeletonema_marinoi.AAC.1
MMQNIFLKWETHGGARSEKEIGRVVSRGEGAAACVERGRGGRSISERYVYDKFNWRVKKTQ